MQQARVGERGELLRDRLPRDRQLGRELGRGRRAARRDRLDERAAPGVAERGEDAVYAAASAVHAKARSSNAGANCGERLDDVHARPVDDRLELDRDAAAVVPVEDEPLRLLELAHDGVPLVAVAPAEDALAAGPRVELDLRREPLLEPLRLGQRLPDLVGRLRHDDLPLDLHRSISHLRNLLVAY